MVGADEVGLHDVVAAGERRGLGGALDDRVELLHAEDVVEHADIAVHEGDAVLAQAREVQLGAAPAQVVQRDERPVGVARGEPDRRRSRRRSPRPR